MARKDDKGNKSTKDKYPTPKKGERVQCLACMMPNGKGRGLVLNPWKPGTWMRCRGCNGKGYHVA